MRILIVIILMLLTALAHGQTHTMPGSNVVPSGGSLTIQSGGTITAAAGSTVTGFGTGGGSVSLTATSPIVVTPSPITGTGVVSLDPTTKSNWDTAATDALKWNGGSTGLTAATGRTSLGGTTVGQSFFTLTNPGAVTFPEISAGNAVSAVSAATMRTDLGGTSVGQSFFTLTNPGAITFPEISATNVVSAKTAAQLKTDLSLTIGTNVEAWDTDLDTWAAITRASGFDTFATTPNSANLRSLLTDENGTGVALFNGASGTITLGNVDFTTATDAIALRNSNANSMTIFRVMPRGTNDAYFQFFATDFLADGTNYEALTFKSSTSGDTVQTSGAGSGTRRSLALSADSTVTQLVLGTTGGVGVGAATDPGAGVLNANTGLRVTNAAASGKVLQGNGTNYVASTPTWPTTAGTAGYTLRSDGTNVASYPQDMLNSSVASQATFSTADIYIAGSNVAVAAGDFKAKGQYHCVFDMTKSAGTGAIVISVRAGTLGTTGDTAQLTFTFGAGTSVADTGVFDVFVTWRTVGSGTSAVMQGVCRAQKNAATTTGLWNNTGTDLVIVATTSSGFASNTFTNIGLSFNGGTAFAGTGTLVQATLVQ